MNLKRGDIGLARFPHAAGGRGKKRPVVIVQSDVYNQKLRHVIVAEVTTNRAVASDPANLLIDVATSGKVLQWPTLPVTMMSDSPKIDEVDDCQRPIPLRGH